MSATLTIPSGQPVPMQPGDFTPAGPAQIVSWQMKRLTPPSPLYVTVDDVLVAGAASSQSAEVVTISYRLLRAMDSKVVLGEFTVVPTNTRAIKVAQQQLAEGFLLSVSCKAAVATTRGQTFVRLFLNPKALGGGQPGLMMMADYVTTAMAPGYPNGRTVTPVEGPGNVVSVAANNPPAGSDWSLSVPTNARWRVRSVNATFNASAAVANRQVIFNTLVGGLQQYTAGAIANITAGQTPIISFVPGTSYAPIAPNLLAVPLTPDLLLLGGSVIGTNTNNLQAGDQWIPINALVEEWLDNV
jgi:hypothetical protein